MGFDGSRTAYGRAAGARYWRWFKCVVRSTGSSVHTKLDCICTTWENRNCYATGDYGRYRTDEAGRRGWTLHGIHTCYTHGCLANVARVDLPVGLCVWCGDAGLRNKVSQTYTFVHEYSMIRATAGYVLPRPCAFSAPLSSPPLVLCPLRSLERGCHNATLSKRLPLAILSQTLGG